MSMSAKSRAERLFTATQRKDEQFLKDKEKAERDKMDHLAKLRALRLAKEAADQEAAETTAAKPAARKK